MSDDKGGAKAPPITTKSPPIERAAYLKALAEAANDSKLGADPLAQAAITRLHQDLKGEALPAVNQLRHVHAPEAVLKKVIEAVCFGQSLKEIRDHAERAASEAYQKADDVRQFMEGAGKDYSPQLSFSLGGLHEYWMQRARGCEIAPLTLGLPKKIEIKNAALTVALRMLRDGLFPKARAPHEPLRLLVSVAAGEDIGATLVREALRDVNSLRARAKSSGLMVPLVSGDMKPKKRAKSTLSKK